MNNNDILIEIEAKKSQSVEQKERLADVTSTVAHDLQAPLRSLTTFTELLTKEYHDELDQKAQQYLQQINSSSSQMQILIEDLLAYSRAGSGEQTWITVDLNFILQQAIEDLQSEIVKTKAEITCGELPQLLINPTEIHQLFQNLIENALKFNDSPTPQVEVRATARENEWLIAIADNGIGIAPEFQLQIFDVFQRLHPVDAYPGTGVGLAICQKITNRYGGKIWVESTVGEGSTFYFTLPMNTVI